MKCWLGLRVWFPLATLVVTGLFAAPTPGEDFVNFENSTTHPVDMSPSGEVLAVCNLADNRVLLYDLSTGTPVLDRSIPVGLDPVSVRFRTNNELWVVNHISDSISIVDVSSGAVVGLISTKDEPADVVFAGTTIRAFVSCSQANTIQVFNVDTRVLQDEIVINAEDPRALAVSPDGKTVYAAIFESGNRSTLLGGGADGFGTISFPPNVVDDPSTPHGVVNPAPNDGASFFPPKNPGNGAAPKVGLIVKQDDDGKWRDDTNADWTDFVSGAQAANSGRPTGWTLIDHDVAVIDADSHAVSYVDHLMNICMAIAVNPATGAPTVIGTDGTNEIRFEPVLRGKFLRVLFAKANPSTLEADAIVDLNVDHVNGYASGQIAQQMRELSIGDPRGIAWNAAGTKAYITGMGSNNLVVVDSGGDRTGLNDPIELGEGPTGLVLDEAREQLYVLNRFDGSLSVVSTDTETETARLPFFDPTPDVIKIGRKHLYDTHKSSGLGQIACASCHVDGRMDRLAWDLGNPAGDIIPLTNRNLGANIPELNEDFEPYHPMKGPMSTQTFQGIIGHEPFHWRGDRLGLEEFNPAFEDLQGDDVQLSAQEMQEFEDFLATIQFPPNPFRNLDNTLPTNLPLPGHFLPHTMDVAAGTPLPNGDAIAGLSLYRDHDRRIDGDLVACVTCHSLPSGNGPNASLNNFVPQAIPDGPMGEKHLMLVAIDGSTNVSLKVAQLRNLYDKVGMTMQGTESRAGFGFLHDGSVDTLERFLSEGAFNTATAQELSNLVALMLAFTGSDFAADTTPPALSFLDIAGEPSSDVHAAVGQQSLENPGASEKIPSLAEQFIALVDRSDRIELVGHFVEEGIMRGVRYRGNDLFDRDTEGDVLTLSALYAAVDAGQKILFTVVPAGTGVRLALDQDRDGAYDYDEILAGTDPADPDSVGGGEGEGEGEGGFHSADTNEDNTISLSELLRVIQFYNSSGFGCMTGTEDGFVPQGTDDSCDSHFSDYAPQDWAINTSELLRAIQLFNVGSYELCSGSEDGVCLPST